jgi:large conductance mechanosensitive channel
MPAPPAELATAEQPAKKSLLREFQEFLDNYGVVGLAIAFIIGAALTDLVKALVSDLLMPTITPALGAMGSNWQTASYNIGPFKGYMPGDFLSKLISFIIIAAFVFLVAKLVLREKVVSKK